jgi:hypothetical protein
MHHRQSPLGSTDFSVAQVTWTFAVIIHEPEIVVWDVRKYIETGDNFVTAPLGI